MNINVSAVQFELSYDKTELRMTFARNGVTELWDIARRNFQQVYCHIEANGDHFLADVITRASGAGRYDCWFSGRFSTYDGAFNALKWLATVEPDWGYLRNAPKRSNSGADLSWDQLMILAAHSQDPLFMRTMAEGAEHEAKKRGPLTEQEWADGINGLRERADALDANVAEEPVFVIAGRSIDGTEYYVADGRSSFAGAHTFITRGEAEAVLERLKKQNQLLDADSVFGQLHIVQTTRAKIAAAFERETAEYLKWEAENGQPA